MSELDLMSLSMPQLLSLHADIQREFQRRGVSRTAGSVQGEVGERLALMVLGGTLPPPGMKGYDLIDGAGRKVQVKTRTLPRGDDRMFQFSGTEVDAAVCIRFERESGRLDWAREYSGDELRSLVSPHAAGPRLPMGRAKANGEDVTSAYRAAYDSLLAAGSAADDARP